MLTQHKRVLGAVLIVSLVAAGIGIAMWKKHIKAAAATAPQAPTVLEFLPTDIVEVRPNDLRLQLALSGSLRAVSQASVKAKVGGEVRTVLVREGEAVTEGQILVKMDTREYEARAEQAKGAWLAARGQLEIAVKTRDNNQALLDKNFISKTAFDNAQSQFHIARANVESAKAALDVAQKTLNDTVIRAPISGLISSRTIQPGEKVSPDNRLLEIVNLREMEMEASVPTADILNIALDQEVQVKVEGLPSSLTGKVTRINPATQAGSRSILVYIQIPNPRNILRVGMFGEAQLTLAKKSGVLTAPQSSIQTDTNGTYLYAIENGRIMQKTVTLGIRGNNGEAGAVEIISGVGNGTQILKTNLGNLRNGTLVQFPSMANPMPNPMAIGEVPNLNLKLQKNFLNPADNVSVTAKVSVR